MTDSSEYVESQDDDDNDDDGDDSGFNMACGTVLEGDNADDGSGSSLMAGNTRHTLLRRTSLTSRDGAVAFAKSCFSRANKNADQSLTKSEIRNYFKAHPEDKAHIVGEDFTWKQFFAGMDNDGDGQFDEDEFVKAVVAVYHPELGQESGSAKAQSAPAPAAPSTQVRPSVRPCCCPRHHLYFLCFVLVARWLLNGR